MRQISKQSEYEALLMVFQTDTQPKMGSVIASNGTIASDSMVSLKYGVYSVGMIVKYSMTTILSFTWGYYPAVANVAADT